MIYFAQPTNGGPIKIGHAGDVAQRIGALSGQSCTGAELLASIPGNTAREEALLWATRPFRLHGEWRRSCGPIWRLVLEAQESGDLPWLPACNGAAAFHDLPDLVRERFRTKTEAARLLGMSASQLPNFNGRGWITACAVGRVSALIALQDGCFPHYLAGAHADMAEAA